MYNVHIGDYKDPLNKSYIVHFLTYFDVNMKIMMSLVMC